MKRIYVISGGTVVHIRPHFAITAPAYGAVGREITNRLKRAIWAPENWVEGDPYIGEEVTNKYDLEVVPIYTRMAQRQTPDPKAVEVLQAAGLQYVETNDDLQTLIEYLKTREDTRCIVMAAAVCDWKPSWMAQDELTDTGLNLQGDFLGNSFGKDKPRLQTRLYRSQTSHVPNGINLSLKPSEKIIGNIRAGAEGRKDIFLVSFKTTAGLEPNETYAAGLRGLKSSSSNLVFANDVQTKTNVVVTPEEFPYFSRTRADALDNLCEMILGRLQLTFTRTVVTLGKPADLQELHDKGAIPPNFLPVLQHLLTRGAYKTLPFKDSTSGHFGCFVEGEVFSRISSIRKVNHNRVMDEGVAKILGTTLDGRIIAQGGRPSVGEHTQQQIYDDINNRTDIPSLQTAVHSIVHFHCPTKPRKDFALPYRPQRMYECGSDQCGINTATGMKMSETGVWAVHLEGHGPNIAFHRDVPAERIIAFIERHWDLDQKSGGIVPEVPQVNFPGLKTEES